MQRDHMLTTITPSVTTPSIAPRRAPRLYLVGEAERSTRRCPTAVSGRTSVLINGCWHQLRGRTATFEQLLRLAAPTQPLLAPQLATITYRHGIAGAKEGVLTPGDAIPLADGLVVTANTTYAS
jgi:hypothetical protein